MRDVFDEPDDLIDGCDVREMPPTEVVEVTGPQSAFFVARKHYEGMGWWVVWVGCTSERFHFRAERPRETTGT